MALEIRQQPGGSEVRAVSSKLDQDRSTPEEARRAGALAFPAHAPARETEHKDSIRGLRFVANERRQPVDFERIELLALEALEIGIPIEVAPREPQVVRDVGRHPG